MCSDSNMEGRSCRQRCSVLLELSASDDLVGFRHEIEVMGSDVNEVSHWYGTKIGLKKMGFEERTPLLVASMYGSINVLKYIIKTGKVDVNRQYSSEKVSALHCAVAGSSNSMAEVIKLLLDASANPNCVNANGNKPIDLLCPSMKTPKRKIAESLLKGESLTENEEEKPILKKEYPVDVPLPDINNGIYGTDEFRMFCFKVKPCSRAYSHDWTECPFVHPGENARRRDPNKFPYSCVPCPEFKKGACQKGDSCEYAHGVFESWLHPAQYRTRLCKDETGCSRKVCFFAHKPEELRPVYASTGSALPSPKSMSMDMPPLSPLALGSSGFSLPTVATPPMSPKSSNVWQNKVNLTPPALGSRLKSAMSARDLDREMEFSGLSSPSHWRKDSNGIDDAFGSLNLSPLHGTGQNVNRLRSSYPVNSRALAFANRSHSFIERGGSPARLGITAAANSISKMSSNLSGWSSPDGKLDWGVQGGELSKLRKSVSFGVRSNNSPPRPGLEEPDVSWVNSLVKDVPSGERSMFEYGIGTWELMPSWMEQMYIEQEQMVA